MNDEHKEETGNKRGRESEREMGKRGKRNWEFGSFEI